MSTKNIFFVYAAAFGLSFVAHIGPWLGPVLFFAACVSFIVLTSRRLEYGFYILFADLFSDSFGYVFAWNGLSIRTVMAGVLVVIFLYKILFDKIRLIEFITKNRSLSTAYVLLALWFAISFLHGWIGNGFQNSFQDFNGFLFLLFLPIVLIVPIRAKTVFTILKASLLWMFILVSSIEFIFSRWDVIPVLYTFIRDNRFGEITPAFGNFFRVFLQSEIYAVVGLLSALVGILHSVIPAKAGIQIQTSKTKRSFGFLFPFLDPVSKHGMTRWGSYVLLFISIVILLLSLSRSFWVGSAVGVTVLVVHSLKHSVMKEWLKRVSIVVGIVLCSGVFVMIISNTGFQTRRVVKDRIVISEPAASSRQAQLAPLHSAIARSPIVGYGFGKELEYVSTDPRRIKESGGTGLVKTWAFELGWHDLTLKTGLIGSLLYCLFIVFLMRMLWSQVQSGNANVKTELPNYPIIQLSMLFSLIALVVVHIFTPYLNHPLGIGILMLVIMTFRQELESSGV